MGLFKEKSKKSILVVSIITFCLLMAVFICFWNVILGYFETDKADNITILLAAIIGLVVPVSTFLILRSSEEKLRIKQEHTKKTIEFYEELIEFMGKEVREKELVLLLNSADSEEMYNNVEKDISKTEIELRDSRRKLPKMLIAWGSENVLDEYYKYSLLRDPTDEQTLGFLKFIRKEIGHKDVYIEDQVLIDLFKKK